MAKANDSKTKASPQVPEWILKRQQASKGIASKLFLFPEGTTTVEIDLNKPCEERDFSVDETRPQVRAIYTAKINGNTERLTFSKRVEAKILKELMAGHTKFEFNRVGLSMQDTKYNIKVLE